MMDYSEEIIRSKTLSDLYALSKILKEDERYYKTQENRIAYGYALVVIQDEIEKRVNQLFAK